MEAKDGSFGFDLSGTYTQVVDQQLIAYTMDGDDARKVKIHFEQIGDQVKVTETFDTETQNPLEMQQAGRQAILENFKKYVEHA